jgi:cytoskeletal protein RodZ
LPSFGEKLKLEREKRKITLEEISSSTKIGTRMLQALEEDKFNQLPGGIFNKGFVRAYSRCVGLDEDQAVADYLQASGDAPPVRTELGGGEDGAHEHASSNNEEIVRRVEAGSDSAAPQIPWGLFAAVLLIVALALFLWSYRERIMQLIRPAPTTTAAPAAAATSGVSIADRGIGSPIGSSPKEKAAPAAAAKTSPDSSPTLPAAAPGEFTVVVQTREDSWVKVTADGKTTSSELLTAGSERTFRARKEIVVKAGNAGGIDLQFNGKKLDTKGEYGEVKTVTFGPQGIVPNPPPPPETP